MPRVTIDGKRRFFFAPNDAKEDWRFKEKIVAVIESILQPFDAVAFSPRRVPNIVGDLEELDVVFTPVGDPTKPYSFIQVRDRQDNQGRPWLQQLIGQCDTLGLRTGTLVSTSDFTGTVKRLAAEKDIPIRTLQLATDVEMSRWYQNDRFRVQLNVYSPVQCAVVALAEGGPITAEFEREQLETGPTLLADYEADLFRLVPPRRLFERLVMADTKHREWMQQVLDRDGDGARATIAIELDQDRSPVWLGLEDRRKPLPALALVFCVEMNQQRIEAPLSHRFIYADPQGGKQLAQVIVGEFALAGRPNYLALVRMREDENTYQVGGAWFS